MDDKLEIQPSTDISEDKQPKNKRDGVDYWRKWIAAAKWAARRHWNDTRRAWREYDGDTERGNNESSKRSYDNGYAGDDERYPIYWSRVKTIESAFYSRTPETFAQSVFGAEDDLSLTMADIVDYLGRYLLRTSDFDAAMKASVANYINSDKTTLQVCYIHQEKKVKKTRAAVQDPNAPESYLDAETGQPVTEEVLFEESAGYMYDIEESEIEIQDIKVKPVVYDQVLHTPTAKMPEDIEDMAYYFCLTRSEAVEMFGEDAVNTWPDSVWKTIRSYDKERRESAEVGEERPSADKFVEGWEIWSRVTRKVYFYCPDYQEGFLVEPKEDPYGLVGFFPSPKLVIGTKPAKTLYPTPVFVRLAPTVNMLHIMYGRVFNLIDAVRRRALVDGTSDELAGLLNDLGDSEFIAVQNMAGLVEKGGLDGLIWYLPVQELVNAIGELNQQDEKFKENIDEWFGTPAILQGTSDPIETATSQEIKVSAAHDRFRNQKNSIAEMARETLEIMIDLALKVWDDQRIFDITGFKYKEPERQQQFLPALEALRNDRERAIRIEIETDTTSYVGEQIRMQQRTAVVQTITKGLQETANMMQTSPEMGKLSLKIMMESLAGIPGGVKFISSVRGAMQKEMEKLDAPPPKPPPDPAMIKVQVDQFKAETDRMRAELEASQTQIDQLSKAFKDQLAQQKQEFDQYIQDQYLKLDGGRLVIEAQNKEQDNARLEVDSQAKLIEAAKPAAPEQGSKESPTTVIINAPSAVPETPSALDMLLKGG